MVNKKLGLTSLFFNSSEASLSSSTSFSTAASWQWPSCAQARTRSFRCDSPEIVSMRQESYNKEDEECKTSMHMNPAYMLDPSDEHELISCSLISSSSSDSLCTAALEDNKDEEAIVRSSLRSSHGRLFFEPESTSSIVNTTTTKKKKAVEAAFDGATALAIDSADPYGDFRRSMEEMVLSHGGMKGDWGWLEEMLGWYLSANGKNTHGLIVGAFVDLLVALTTSAPSPACCSSDIKGNKKGKRQLLTETE